MNTWKVLTQVKPTDGQEVWVRINYWFGEPFLATWNESTETFEGTETGLTYPSWVVMRWREQ